MNVSYCVIQGLAGVDSEFEGIQHNGGGLGH